MSADQIHARQGGDIAILDVSGPLAIADYFVIATARNHRHAQSLGRELVQLLKAEGVLRRNAAGLETESGWVLLDFNDVVVHVFLEDQREFYGLESLWADATRIPFEPSEQPADAGSLPSGPEGVVGDGWPLT